MRPPLTRRGQRELWGLIGLLLLSGMMLGWLLGVFMAQAAFGAELRWKQGDGEAPIKQWHLRRFQSPTPIATILRTLVPEQPSPTTGPGTPTPAGTTRFYRLEIPDLPGGTIVDLLTEDDRGLLSDPSNVKQLPTETFTPVATRTPSNTRTQSPTRSATNAKPSPAVIQ